MTGQSCVLGAVGPNSCCFPSVLRGAGPGEEALVAFQACVSADRASV